MDNKRLSLLYNIERIYNKNEIGTTDYQLAKFFLDHYASIIDLNIYEVAEANHVSRATVRRFCDHLGYKNFKEMKQHFQDFNDGVEKFKNFYYGDDFRITLQSQINLMLEELTHRMNSNEKRSIINKIVGADEVFIIASSTIASSIKIFQQNLTLFGKRVSLIVDRKDMENLQNLIKEDSLIIVFSISGLLAESIENELNQLKGIKMIFTIKRNPIYNRWFDNIYHLRGQESTQISEVLYYTYGITYVLDLLFKEYLDYLRERG